MEVEDVFDILNVDTFLPTEEELYELGIGTNVDAKASESIPILVRKRQQESVRRKKESNFMQQIWKELCRLRHSTERKPSKVKVLENVVQYLRNIRES